MISFAKRAALCAVFAFGLVASAQAGTLGKSLQLSKEDRAAQDEALGKVMAPEKALGSSEPWTNEKSGNAGSVTLLNRFAYKDFKDCATVRYDYKLKRTASQAYLFDLCRTPDGIKMQPR